MKRFIISSFFSLFSFIAISQRGGGGDIPLEDPRNDRTNFVDAVETLPNCNGTVVFSGCDYINNGGFVPSSIYNPSYGPHLNNPFGIPNVMPYWGSLGGMPRLVDAIGSLPPTGYTKYASLESFGYSSNSPTGTADVITERIQPLVAGGVYDMSFLRRFSLATSVGAPIDMDKFYVVLVHCSDLASMSGGSPWSPAPTLPLHSQIIYCESNISDTKWRNVLFEFTANEDFNAVVIYPKQRVTDVYLGFNKNARINISGVQLIAKNSFTVNATASNNNCKTTLTAICGLANVEYSWTDPNGNIVGNGQQLIVDASTDYGSYTLTIIPPFATNNTCSNNRPNITASYLVPQNCTCGSLQVATATAQYYNASTGNSSLYTQTLNTCSINDLCYNNNEILWLTLSSNQASGNHWEFFFSNPTQYNSGFNYYTGTAYDQSIYGFFVITPNETGTLEIRLTNSVTGTVKSIFVRIQYKASAGWWCNSLDPAYEYRMIGSSTENPYNTYSWTFPSGMVVSDLHVRLPNFSYTTTYTGTYPANAVLTVTNAYCPSYTSTVPIQPGNPYCYARTANTGTTINPLLVAEELEKKTSVKIYPNPTSTSFEIQTVKKLNEVTLSSIEGKLIKRFQNIGAKKSFNIGELSKGSYLVTICYADFSKETKIIIKQ